MENRFTNQKTRNGSQPGVDNGAGCHQFQGDMNKLNRALRLLSNCNQILIHAETEQALLNDVCQEIVETGGYLMTWVGFAEHDAHKTVRPVAQSGFENGYLENARISWADNEQGRGPTGTAVRTGTTQVNQNFLNNPLTHSWRKSALRRGYEASIALPLIANGTAIAALSIYAKEPDAFNPDETKLLEELADDLAFGINALRTRADHIDAERQLQLAASVFQASSEGMMVVDAEDHIVSVNPAFTAITGYSPEGVIGKTPEFLVSGHYKNDFYRQAWHELESASKWEGEILCRRNTGEGILTWVSIATVDDRDPAVRRFVVLIKDISDRKHFDTLMWKQTNFDLLSGLPNKRLFHDRLEQEIKKAQRSSSLLSLLFVDLDGFKDVNDSLGHSSGDLLLKEVSQRIVSCVRDSDTVARLGGDEFAVLLAGLGDLARIEQISQTIIELLCQPYEVNGAKAYVTASIGIAIYPADAGTADRLLTNAERAMYVSKSDGRNRLSYFTSDIQDVARERFRLIQDLHEALPNNELMLHFQPICDMKSGDILKAESLLRWSHPELGMVSPAKFIPLAESSSLIHEIGDWVFRESVRSGKKWGQLLGRQIKVGVNMSPVQFTDKFQSEKWIDHLIKEGHEASCLIVELTEGVLLKDRPEVQEALLRFRDAGIEVAIDDFGTGYSSLSYLNKFHVDYLKIDQSFTRNLAPHSSELTLSKAIIVMAHELGMKVIAEGIETPEQNELLLEAGCDYGQGYHYSRPLPPESFESLLMQHVQ